MHSYKVLSSNLGTIDYRIVPDRSVTAVCLRRLMEQHAHNVVAYTCFCDWDVLVQCKQNGRTLSQNDRLSTATPGNSRRRAIGLLNGSLDNTLKYTII